MSDKAPAAFYVEVDLSATLQINEIWPDGDAPEEPTLDDVIAVMHGDAHDARDLIHKWDFIDRLTVVTVTRLGPTSETKEAYPR